MCIRDSGWYLKKIGSISIDRGKVTKNNLDFLEKVYESMLNSNRPLIIFPQGTRVLPNERPPFKRGVSKIYEKLNIACQPVAINSGNVWPKNGEKKSGRTITVSVLPQIDKNLGKEQFLKNLEEKIYHELNLIS